MQIRFRLAGMLIGMTLLAVACMPGATAPTPVETPTPAITPGQTAAPTEMPTPGSTPVQTTVPTLLPTLATTPGPSETFTPAPRPTTPTRTGARTIAFAGRTWTVRPNGSGGPGPNDWSADNAWVDASGQLHLKISQTGGKWYCAEVTSMDALGFGQYQWYVSGRVDRLDKNVVFGLFPYAGPDGQNEIDIEMSRWGNAGRQSGNFTVYPARSGLARTTQVFGVSLSGDESTQRIDWQSQSVVFQMLQGYRSDDSAEIWKWRFSPERYLDLIPQQPMPLHMNLWLYQGVAPSDGREVEIVIRNFTYRP